MNEDLLREVLSNRAITAEAVKMAKEWVAEAWAETDRLIAAREAYHEKTKNVSVGRY